MTPTLTWLPRVSFHFTNPSSATYGNPHTTGTLTDVGASLQLSAIGEQQKSMRMPGQIVHGEKKGVRSQFNET